jgi:ribosomal protein S3AE
MADKKKFFDIEIPLTNSSVELFAYSIDSFDNKTIKLDLTRQLRGKSIEVVFKIKVDGKKASGRPVKLTLLPFFIRRMIRRNISYVEDSFSVECTDAFVRIKPFFITRKRVSRAVRKALRDEAKNWILDYIKNKGYEEIFSDIISNRMQKSLSLKLKKIYPLSLCEIRILELEKLKEQETLKVGVEKVEKAEKSAKKKSESAEESEAEDETKEEDAKKGDSG